jgi:hypothetical protein
MSKSTKNNVSATKSPNFSNPDLFQLKRSFAPALNKEGYSQLTYLGYEHSVTKDGENGFMKLVFSVRDLTNKAPESIPVLVNYRLSEENKFGKVLEAMGCKIKALEVEYDDDGFEVAVGDSDFSYVYKYLDNHMGKMYLALLTNEEDKPGLYRIDTSSLKPFLDKEGNQRTQDVIAA